MYLVIGGNGYLGSYIIQSILNTTDEKITATARDVSKAPRQDRVEWTACDITDEAAFDGLLEKVREEGGDVKCVFLAAYHHPDMVAQNPQTAWDINVTALSRCVNKLHFAKKLFYASTDSVYGNSVGGYHFKEGDELHPVNVYGRNKAAAEAVVVYSGFNVVRFPFLIAPSLAPSKKHFYDFIAEDLLAGKPVEMFEDSYRSSLNFATAADLTVRLCETEGEVPSVLNVCGDEDLSKYDVGLLLADKLGVSRELVRPIKAAGDNGIFKSPRALSTLMDNSKLKGFLGLSEVRFVI